VRQPQLPQHTPALAHLAQDKAAVGAAKVAWGIDAQRFETRPRAAPAPTQCATVTSAEQRALARQQAQLAAARRQGRPTSAKSAPPKRCQPRIARLVARGFGGTSSTNSERRAQQAR
jgi:hypothetical protein